MKIAALIALMFFVSCAWCACDSCGSECAPACGTRRFRACCFNYLRKKRGPDTLKIHSLDQDMKGKQTNSELPVFIIERVPATDEWKSNKNYPYFLEDMIENRMDLKSDL